MKKVTKIYYGIVFIVILLLFINATTPRIVSLNNTYPDCKVIYNGETVATITASFQGELRRPKKASNIIVGTLVCDFKDTLDLGKMTFKTFAIQKSEDVYKSMPYYNYYKNTLFLKMDEGKRSLEGELLISKDLNSMKIRMYYN